MRHKHCCHENSGLNYKDVSLGDYKTTIVLTFVYNEEESVN
jgi:hypothetical protein